MLKRLKESYQRVPLPLRKAICWLPYGLLIGSSYRKTRRLCARLDAMSRRDVVGLQEERLGEVLEFAVQEVPFYESLRGIVRRLNPFDALREFPLLSKEDVQQNFDSLIPRSIRKIPHHEGTTGGSSGNQLTFLEDDSTYAREMGFMHSQWARVGYLPKSRKATFRGVGFSSITDTCFWQENPIHSELQFSPFHMSEGNLSQYVKKLGEYQPEFIHGYPSAVDCLAEYVLRHEITEEMSHVRAVLLGSEACSEAQRDRIEAAFRTRVYTWYGHSERTVLGGECECSRVYHAFPAYGILEIIRKDGKPCDVGENGEIVGTGFINRSMPLIRYRTDDYATREPYGCQCGRCWDRFSNVLDRRSLEGFLIGKNGSKISIAAINMHGNLFENVVRHQYYQNTPGQLVIRVIPNSKYSPADEKRIISAYESKLWNEMGIVVKKVRDIPLTSLGKQRRIISDIKSSFR
ncbi:MAG: phenylacetate--CoA ligase family protein [Planctomycetota bacterium]|jgi:phenylacetate-CoA ligase